MLQAHQRISLTPSSLQPNEAMLLIDEETELLAYNHTVTWQSRTSKPCVHALWQGSVRPSYRQLAHLPLKLWLRLRIT